MGTCYSREDEQYQQPQHHRQSLKNNSVGVGHGAAVSPTKANSTSPKSPESHETKNASSILVIPKNVKDLRQNPGNSNLDIFTYEEMQLATKRFRPDQVLGEGGFGIVYKGVIDENVRPGYKKTQVAIKELDPEGIQGDREWLAEVNYLGQLQHPNLVKLIGYCCDDDHRLLAYEYMASGSLENHLFCRVCATLTWSRRINIALDAAGVDVRRQQHKKGLKGSVIALIVLSASIAVILCCAVAWVLLFRHTDHNSQPEQTAPTNLPSLAKSSGITASVIGSGPSSVSLSYNSSIAPYTGTAKTYNSSDIERATDNFDASRILGEGGFGLVYGGVLEDGTKVAVKVLKRDDQQGGREFLAEVEMLSRLHHRNLVRLIGICTEERARCLVYELIPNGSVESHLHGVDNEDTPLDWGARLKIALGAARGLAYLHEDSSPRVIHRDFKSSNILLEHDFTPKVSDFGLARTALDEENRHISTRVMGTFGYVAPEYAMTGHLLVKSDVYSYGVVLLELLTGRKPVDMSQPPGQENLVTWSRPLLTSKEGLELMTDQSLGPDFPFDSIAKVAVIASMCVQPEVSHRPFMGEVVQALKLVCNECDATRDLGSRSCSQEDLSVDFDARLSTNSGHLPDPLQMQSPLSDYVSALDLERGLPVSELFSASARLGRTDSGSFRRHSSSGPLRSARVLPLWQRMRRLSGGSLSEHGVMFRSWPGSH